MRRWGAVPAAVWRSRELREDPGARELAIYFCSAPTSEQLGIYYIPLALAAHELGRDLADVERSLEALEAIGFVRYDHEHDVVWVVGAAGEAWPDPPKPKDNRYKSCMAPLRQVDGPLLEAFLAYYRARGWVFPDGLETSKGLGEALPEALPQALPQGIGVNLNLKRDLKRKAAARARACERPPLPPFVQELEATFRVEVLDRPLLAEEIRLATAWEVAGYSLALAQEVIRELGARERRKAKRIGHLGYFAEAIADRHRAGREVVERRLEAPARSGTDAPPLDLGERLRRLAESLPDRLPRCEELRQQIRALEDRSTEDAELALGELDDKMIELAREELGEERLAQLRERVTESLEALRARLPGAEVRRNAERFLARAVREELSLPWLSLFAIEDFWQGSSESPLPDCVASEAPS